MAERFKEQKRIFEYGGGFIQDRSIYEDTGIFAKMHQEKGTMDPVDYETFITYFETAHPEIPVLRFNGDELDFVNSGKDLQFILDTVDATIQKGAALNELT